MPIPVRSRAECGVDGPIYYHRPRATLTLRTRISTGPTLRASESVFTSSLNFVTLRPATTAALRNLWAICLHGSVSGRYRRRRYAVVNPMKAKRIMGHYATNRLHLVEVAAVKPHIVLAILHTDIHGRNLSEVRLTLSPLYPMMRFHGVNHSPSPTAIASTSMRRPKCGGSAQASAKMQPRSLS